MAVEKKRFDQLLAEIYPHYSRQQIQGWIMQGKAYADGKQLTKPGTMLRADVPVRLEVEEPKFVGRAGFKLEAALDHFGIDVTGMIAMDAGISTGGFTDCLLQRGISRVYGVDVGYGQLHEKIRNDARVIVRERTNLRDLETLGEQVDVVTLDLSFISVLKVMDAVSRILKPDGKLIILIKPQFEAQKHAVGRGGIIKNPSIHNEVIERVKEGMHARGFTCHGVIESPILGGSGNKEFLAYFTRMV